MSGEHTNTAYALAGVIDGVTQATTTGVEHDALLDRFASAICRNDQPAMAAARSELTNTLGASAMIDCASVIAAFNAYPRVADATGIPLEAAKEEGTRALRLALQLDRFDTAS